MDELLKYLEEVSQDWHEKNFIDTSNGDTCTLSFPINIKQLDELIDAIKLHNLLNSVKQERIHKPFSEPKTILLSDIE